MRLPFSHLSAFQRPENANPKVRNGIPRFLSILGVRRRQKRVPGGDIHDVQRNDIKTDLRFLVGRRKVDVPTMGTWGALSKARQLSQRPSTSSTCRRRCKLSPFGVLQDPFELPSRGTSPIHM